MSKRNTWAPESQALIDRCGRPVLYFPRVAQVLKQLHGNSPACVAASIILVQSLFWTGRSTRHADSWFEKTDVDFSDELGLGESQFRNGVQILLGLALVERRIETNDDGRITLYRVSHPTVARWLMDNGFGQLQLAGLAPQLPEGGDTTKRGNPLPRNAVTLTAKRGVLIDEITQNQFDDDDARASEFRSMLGDGPTGWGIDEPTLSALAIQLAASSATPADCHDTCARAAEAWARGQHNGSPVHNVKGLIVSKVRALARDSK